MRFPLLNHGILGMNARNLLYVKPYNPRRSIALADDKLKAKAFLSARGIPTARVYAHIETEEQLRVFDFSSLPDQCVLKPNFGFGGEGIRVLKSRKNGKFLEGRSTVTDGELREHIGAILQGSFAVNGQEDSAFFEQILSADESFSSLRPAGLPDVRIIVFNLVPVIAMIRVPTLVSGGKANVHLGGIGIGIDLAKGITTYATQYNRRIEKLPSGVDVRGHSIPYWNDLLLIAARIQQITDIGYLAVDLTVDDKSGPMLLEVNARAGLMVQVANLVPLRSRLERVKGLSVSTPEKGVLLSQEMFGQRVQTKKTISKIVLGLYETVKIPLSEGDLELTALINPGTERTVLIPTLLDELRQQGIAEPEDVVKGTYRIKLMLSGRKLQTIVTAGTIADSSVKMSVGRRDLQDFLIDPQRHVPPVSKEHIRVKVDLYAVDRQLARLERSMPILRLIKPLNYEQVRSRAADDLDYEPQFLYEPLPFDPADMRYRLSMLAMDDSPLGKLLSNKRDELFQRIDLLSACGDNAAFERASIALYGDADVASVQQAQQFIDSRLACDLPPSRQELLKARQVKERFEAAIAEYGLHDWAVVIRETMASDCAVGNKHVYIRRDKLFEPQHVEALVAHELEAHALCAENGLVQPYLLLSSGTSGYLSTQEGLAVYLQIRVLSQHHDKRYWPAQGVLAIEAAKRSGLKELRLTLESIGYTRNKALTKALSLKRGCGDTSQPGSFTKDMAYFVGQRMVEEFVREGGDLKRLYIGRISLPDLKIIEALPGIRKPVLLPKYL